MASKKTMSTSSNGRVKGSPRTHCDGTISIRSRKIVPMIFFYGTEHTNKILPVDGVQADILCCAIQFKTMPTTVVYIRSQIPYRSTGSALILQLR